MKDSLTEGRALRLDIEPRLPVNASPSVLQVSAAVSGGGAERMALVLHQGLVARGTSSWLAVGADNADVERAYSLRDWPTFGQRVLGAGAAVLRPVSESSGAAGRLQRRLLMTDSLAGLYDYWRGHEQLDYPGTRRLLDEAPEWPDLVHCHNLHGRYFDIRELGRISQKTNVVLTLHDEWMLTGHCSATMGCERWRDGCGSCPDLRSYPSVRRDATGYNLQVKAETYRASRLHVSTPSEWLMRRARESRLALGTIDWRVIPNAIDSDVFKPADRRAAREAVRINQSSQVLVFVANNAKTNPFKQLSVVRHAAEIAAERSGRPTLLVVLGDVGEIERNGNLEVRYVRTRDDPSAVAQCLQAADLMLHSAKAEVAGLAVVEALACGTPVVATAVGGIPESVRNLRDAPGAWDGASYGDGEASGILVPPADAGALGEAAAYLLERDELRATLGINAARDARSRFGLDTYVEATAAWYDDIMQAG